MASLLVRQMKVGDEQNFVYLLIDEPSGEALAIDSGWEIDPIATVVRDENLELKFAVATHHHSDHAATLWQLARMFDVEVVAHRSSPLSCDLRVDDGDTLAVGELKVKVLHTPGHTEDSICIYDGRNLFTGDTVLIGACGRTDIIGGSPKKLYASLQTKILKLPNRTILYPGHDYGSPFPKSGRREKAQPRAVGGELCPVPSGQRGVGSQTASLMTNSM
jgi:glyoxylase-like metal-dependent hydrolase (beta-lactamase superfamily II)